MIRMKVSTLHEITEGYDITDEKAKNLLSDEDIRYLRQHTSLDYAGELRCVRFLDYDDKEVVILPMESRHCAASLQEALGHRDFLQRSEAELEHQVLLWHIIQRSDDTGLDNHDCYDDNQVPEAEIDLQLEHIQSSTANQDTPAGQNRLLDVAG